MKKISNPLTIIGFFAGIAEVAGTVVLPFVTDILQPIFIWYVMGFPVILVLAFFLTLNFNRKALYVPSDFDDEKHFMDLFEVAKEDNPDSAEEINRVQNLFIKAKDSENAKRLSIENPDKFVFVPKENKK